jgi:hypothetical protein
MDGKKKQKTEFLFNEIKCPEKNKKRLVKVALTCNEKISDIINLKNN